MDCRTISFDWNRARAFLVTAEEGSLSAAARALGLTQPTLGRQVSALEVELGIALFERAGRGLELTPAGLDLLAHVRTMAEAAARVSNTAAGRVEAIEGPVTITASEINAAYLLPPIVARLRAEHPGISVEIVATTEVRDLKRREADIAIRNGRPTQNDLIARKLGDDTAELFAAPRYIDRLGRPLDRDRVSGAEFISFERRDMFVTAFVERGLDVTEASFPVVSENHLVQLELVRQGHGIGVFPTSIGLSDPGLERVDIDFEPISYPTWIVAHRELSTNRRIRLVFDLIAEMLGHRH